ncbi:MAG: helix-turn-helix domain-containing protein [Thermoleophilaceae bacterium]
MTAARLVRRARAETGLSVRALAVAAGVAASTVHRIEKAELEPTVDLLRRILEAAGMHLRIEPELDYAASLVGLARSIREDVASQNHTWPIRKTAELVTRFRHADPDKRHRMITAEPPSTGDQRWDAFVAAVAEWLAVQHGLETPGWAHNRNRYLRRGWWITPMASMRAWEYAGSPASFKNRGVYVHRESLVNV